MTHCVINRQSYLPAPAINLFIAALAMLVALPLLFSTLAPYDDEGYVMMTIRSFSEGRRLYAETYTQYGPAFYLWTEPLHSMLGWPLTQDAVRLKTAFIWVLSCLLVYQIVLRVGRSQLAAAATALVCAVHLEKLALEPGHPQEFVLLFGLLAVRLVSEKGNHRWWLVGILAAIVGLTKINCGAVLACGLLVAAAWQTKRGDARAGTVLLALAALLPSGILLQSIRASQISMLPLHLFLSLTCLVWITNQRWRPRNSPRHGKSFFSSFVRVSLLQVVAGGIFGSVFIILWAMANGNSASELWFGIIAQHSQFTGSFFHPIQAGNEVMFFASALLFISTLSIVRLPSQMQTSNSWLGVFKSEYWKTVGIFGVWFVLIIFIAQSAANPLRHGLEVRGAATWISFLGPAIAPWVLLRSRLNSSRLALAVLACLSPLIAFPTPGTQLSIGTVPGLVLAGVLLSDVIVAIKINAGQSSLPKEPELAIRTLCFLAVMLIPFSSGPALYRYMKNPSLGLPGASLMRLDAATVAEQRAIAQAISSSGLEYLAFDGHNHNRFYFWTGKQPLSGLNPTFWPRLLSDEDMANQLNEVEKRNRVCVVVVPEVEQLAGGRASQLRQSLSENWTTLKQVGNWTIGVRSNANPSLTN
jgi:hypothetical protein